VSRVPGQKVAMSDPQDDKPEKPLSARVAPRSGFDWTTIDWSAPDQPPPADCACCGAPLAGDPVPPLEIRTSTGWLARICNRCVGAWWDIDFGGS
jgi:hypothetical protein